VSCSPTACCVAPPALLERSLDDVQDVAGRRSLTPTARLGQVPARLATSITPRSGVTRPRNVLCAV
jgi:hypothetical protein